jgi:hypothetical protein
MAVGGRGLQVNWNRRALDELLLSPRGPVGRSLQRAGEAGTQEAKRLAPVSPHGSNGRPSGYLRSQIAWEMGADARGQYVDIGSPAQTPEGFNYGLANEVGTSKMPGTPHLRPALPIAVRAFGG